MNSDDVSEKLRVWQVEPRIPATFQREVWARIAARDDTFPHRAGEWIGSLFVQPRYAVLLAAVALTFGLASAHEQAQQANARYRARLEARYALTVSPFLQEAAQVHSTPEL
jgi:hypothetical protein